MEFAEKMAKICSLYAEFADEDRELAEIGMSNYAEGLKKEDKSRVSNTSNSLESENYGKRD